MLMQGGTMSSGRDATLSVSGAYWMICISSFSKITEPSEAATLVPTSKAVSSVMEMRPRRMSSIRLVRPACMVSPFDSSAPKMASGFVVAKFAGLMASANWREKNRSLCFSRGSTAAASTMLSRSWELSR